jgi:hypothetical protein
MTESKTLAQLEALNKKLPMNRHDRLLHFAAIVQRQQEWGAIRYDYFLERKSTKTLRAGDASRTLLGLAFRDPVFKEAGLAGHTYGDVMDFLDITHSELHEFACGCHLNSQEDVVGTIKALAAVGRPKGFWATLFG